MSGIRARGLRIAFGADLVVDGVDLEIAPGECVAIVGESGAGKSQLAQALLGLSPGRVSADELTIDGADATAFRESDWRRIRGSSVALVAQDALVSLDPLRRVGAEVAEPLEIHRRMPRLARRALVERTLTAVGMPDAARRANQRPHELSGGLRQRALLASALVAEPAIVVADEPTTALDATVQARVLDLLRGIVDRGTGLVLISHDLAAVARVADRIIVMRAGRVVEQGPAAQILTQPQEPYTRELLAAATLAPRLPAPGGAVVLEATGLSKSFDAGPAAVVDASLVVARGRTLGLVGESGSGKTTILRMLAGIEPPDAGAVTLEGQAWVPGAERDRRARRRRIQLVPQNPRAAFDPRWTVGRSLREALAAGGVPRAERHLAAARLFGEVELDPALLARRPDALSGGQRQRAAIARALATDPEILLLDEPVSALDVTVQSRILALLGRLQQARDLAVVLVSHDLGVVAALADDVIVLNSGAIVERGATAEVFARPQHPFTRELIEASTILPRSDR